MSFVQIGFLGAFAALAIPILIHLMFRQKSRPVDMGTLRFLRVVLEQNARRRRVMKWLLLSLRLALVALLAFLFARPYLISHTPAGAVRTVAILIDQSASMELKAEGERLIDLALADVREILEQAGPKTRFEIAFFDHAVRPLVAPHADGAVARDWSPRELSDKLQSPEALHGATDYGAAMEWARDILTKAPAGDKSLHVYTDLQRSGLAWSDVDGLPTGVASHLHDLGRSTVNNVAVTETRVDRPWLRPNEPTSVHVTLYNGGPFTTEELLVELELANGEHKLAMRERLKVEPGATESLRFDLASLAEGLWSGKVRVSLDDDLPADNERPVAVLASQPYQVLLVDGQSSSSAVLAATYFLETSLRLSEPGERQTPSLFEPRRIAAEDAWPPLDKYDVVALANVGDIDASVARKLANFVEGGGGLLVFTGDNVTADHCRTLTDAGLVPGKIAGVAQARELPFRLQTWDEKHPIFAAFRDPQLGDLKRFGFHAHTTIEPAAGAKTLATWRDDQAAVLESSLGKGKIVWCSWTADRGYGDWTRSRLYLPVVYQLVGYETGWLAGGKVRYGTLDTAGIIEPLAPGIYEREGYVQVVSPSPRESETDRSQSQEFAARFGLKLSDEMETSEPASVQVAAVGSELLDSECWPWLAIALLGLLVVEGMVANRTSA
jgi:hypothetical protein